MIHQHVALFLPVMHPKYVWKPHKDSQAGTEKQGDWEREKKREGLEVEEREGGEEGGHG